MSTLAKKNVIDFTEGSLIKKLIIFTLPIIGNQLLQTMYNTVDMMVVGQYAPNGAIAMAAVGACGPLIRLFINFFFGIAAGVGVCVAQKIGAHEEKEVEKYIHTAATMSFICGIIIMIVGFIATEPLLILTGVEDPEIPELLPEATAYMRAYFIGIPAMMVLNFLSASLRAAGDTIHTMIFMAIAGAVHVVVNIVIVVCFGLGAVGVGIGTTITQTLAAVMIIVYMMRLDGMCRLSFKKLAMFKENVLGILHNGIPVGLQNAIFAVSNVIVQTNVNAYGPVVMAGASAAANLEGYVYTIMNAIAVAVITVVSQNVGARKYDRVKKIVLMSVIAVTAIGLVLGALITLFGEQLLGFYLSDDGKLDPELVIEAGQTRLLLTCLPYFLCGIMECLTSALKGMRRAFTSMILSVIGLCGFKIAWISIMKVIFPGNVAMLYLSFPLAWILTSVMSLVVFISAYREMSGKSKKAELLEQTI